MDKLLNLLKDELKSSQVYLAEWEKIGEYPSKDSTPEYEQGYSNAIEWVINMLERHMNQENQ